MYTVLERDLGCPTVEYPDALLVADSRHRWGLSPSTTPARSTTTSSPGCRRCSDERPGAVAGAADRAAAQLREEDDPRRAVERPRRRRAEHPAADRRRHRGGRTRRAGLRPGVPEHRASSQMWLYALEPLRRAGEVVRQGHPEHLPALLEDGGPPCRTCPAPRAQPDGPSARAWTTPRPPGCGPASKPASWWRTRTCAPASAASPTRRWPGSWTTPTTGRTTTGS